jgi:hypothetical protein
VPVVLKVKNGKYCVVEKASGKTKKCYTSKAPALEYLQVLNMAHKGLLRSQKNKK